MTNREKYILSIYEELTDLGKHENIKLVKNSVTDYICVKKILTNYNKDIYITLKNENIPGIPKIHEIIENENELIVIEDYVHGQTLEQKYRDGADADAVKMIAKKLCRILNQLHNLTPPIIHRDIKPSNIIISNEGNLYLADFNISREYVENQSRDTVIMGTQGYASPEQCGFAQTDCRSDIYSIGMLMTNMLKENNDNGEENRLQRVIEKCTSIDPDKRYKSVEQLERILGVNDRKTIDELNVKVKQNTISSLENKKEKISRLLQIKRQPESITKSFLPPGFRHGRIINIIVSMIGYISIISVAMDTNAGGNNVYENVIMKIMMFTWLTGTVFLCFNWRGIRDKLPIVRSQNIILRIGGGILYSLAILTAVIVIAQIIISTII